MHSRICKRYYKIPRITAASVSENRSLSLGLVSHVVYSIPACFIDLSKIAVNKLVTYLPRIKTLVHATVRSEISLLCVVRIGGLFLNVEPEENSPWVEGKNGCQQICPRNENTGYT